MKKRTIVATVMGTALAAGIATGAAAVASGGDDGEGTATGAKADRAAAAAIAETGGTVNAVELDDEKGATWEVEVKKDDGSVVDVRLDESYHVVTIDSDREGHGQE